MKIKTKGECLHCHEVCNPVKAKTHLLQCTCNQIPDTSKEGFLIQIASAEKPSTYWMFIAMPKESSLKLLDQFLRDIWLECCGHLSQFTIESHEIFSRTESGNPSQAMKKQIGQILFPGLQFNYRYDMGSSTNLVLEVIESIPVCSQKKVTLLMRNEPPIFLCEFCKTPANTICSFCGETMCSSCEKSHACVIQERDTYMLMSLVNSPRTGVCGYNGC